MFEKYRILKENYKEYISEKTHLVIDFDSMLFKLASSAEKTQVRIINNITGDEVGLFKNKTEFFGRSKKEINPTSELGKINIKRLSDGLDEFSPENFDIEVVQTPIVGYNTMMNNLNMWVNDLCESLGIPNSKVIHLMGDSGSFRDDFILPKKYKDNRSDQVKPVMLKKLRNIFEEKYNPPMYEKYEADDVLAMYQRRGYASYMKTGKTDFIVATIDKDAYGTCGFIINYDKYKNEFKDNSLYLIPDSNKDIGEITIKNNAVKGVGFKWFICQGLLLGDTGDNYYTYQYFDHLSSKYGQKAAFNDVKDIKDPKDLLEYAVNKWKEWFPSGYVEYTSYEGDNIKEPWYDFANKIFLCAYMKRSLSDDMDLFKLLDNFGVTIEKVQEESQDTEKD